MKSKILFFTFLISILFVAGCSKEDESIETETYKGQLLHIGIIGEVPEIKEDNVTFTNIEFSNLQNEANLLNYDAIFITKEKLEEADQSIYTKVYNTSHIPFLFIEPPKSYVPLIYEDIDFEEFPDDESGMYAYLYDSDSEHIWGFGLYNDIVNEQNIQSTYSDIFKRIEVITISKE